MSDILTKIERVLELRKTSSAGESYVAGLYNKGLDAILKKIGEEAAETIIAAKDGERAKQVHELADLWFHCLVLMGFNEIKLDMVLKELENRFGISGIEEKRSRKNA